VIACIGESKQDREAAQRELLLYGQASVLTARVSNWTNLVLAYEPVWATETGEIPDPKEVSSSIISQSALKTIQCLSKGDRRFDSSSAVD
jgi:triosephosphate isomerase